MMRRSHEASGCGTLTASGKERFVMTAGQRTFTDVPGTSQPSAGVEWP